jgi:hypothetical protein
LSVWRSRPSNYCRILSSWYVYLLSSENSFAYQCLSEPAHFRLSHPHIHGFNGFWRGEWKLFARQQYLAAHGTLLTSTSIVVKLFFWRERAGVDSMNRTMKYLCVQVKPELNLRARYPIANIRAYA